MAVDIFGLHLNLPFMSPPARPAPARPAPASPAGPPPSPANAPADLSGQVGTLNYYQARATDFERRNPGQQPPDYYLNYGDKYMHRFHDQLRPQLSGQGQQWVDRTLVSLQSQMEAKRAQDPAAFAALERNPTAFRQFAFSTHPQAYIDSGLGSLPLQDDLKILSTPDVKDSLSPEGLQQITNAAGVLAHRETPSMFEDMMENSLLDLVA